jgi:hypothetical protein
MGQAIPVFTATPSRSGSHQRLTPKGWLEAEWNAT